MMTRNSLTQLFAISMSFALGAACVEPSAPEPAAADQVEPGALLVVAQGPGSADLLDELSPARLASDQIVAALDQRTGELASALGDPSAARIQATQELVAGASGVFADLAVLDPEQAATDPLFAAALESGVPIILSNADDGRVMGAITGLGIEAGEDEVTVIQSVTDNRALIVQMNAPSTLMNVRAAPTETVTVTADGVSAPVLLERADEDPVANPPADLRELATAVDSILVDHAYLAGTAFPESFARAQNGKQTVVTKADDLLPDCPATSCYQWYYSGSNGTTGNNLLERTYNIDDGSVTQSPVYSLRFVITLYDSINPDVRLLAFHSLGHVSTGGMAKNSSSNRGYYNEAVNISTSLASYFNQWTGDYYPTFVPSDDVALIATSPANTNNTSTVTTSDSISIGTDAASYSASWELSRSISDWDIVNRSIGMTGLGAEAEWDYDLSASNGGNYSSWTSLIDNDLCDIDLHGLGNIATENLQPATLSIWDAPRTFKYWARFDFHLQHDVRRTWQSNNTVILGCETSATHKSTLYQYWTNRQIWVNFNKVNQS